MHHGFRILATHEDGLYRMLMSYIRGAKWDMGAMLLLSLMLFNYGLTAQSTQPSSANPAVTGAPMIRNYPPGEYNSHNQNWAIVQDHRGVMYFGNTHGVLEYDGVSWRLILTKSGNIIRSLALADDGTIYVGGFGEIGYLAPDSTDQLQFVSLNPQLDVQDQDFNDVWQTLITEDGVYFTTAKSIFRWNGIEMRVWRAETSFHVGFQVNGRFFVRQVGRGLMEMKSDSLVLAPLGDRFAEERITVMLPFSSGNQNEILLATRANGMFLYNGQTLEKFATEADAMIKEDQVYCGTELPNNLYAFGTLQNGIVIMDEKGRVRHHINKGSGLQDETIWYLFHDMQGGLWAGMHVGICRLEIGSPLTHFGEREGLEGSALQIVRHKNWLYAATSMGIYYLDESRGKTGISGRFHRVTGVPPQAWALQPFGNSLLAATYEGVFEIQESNGHEIDRVNAMSFARSQNDTNRVFVGMQRKVKSLYHENGRWRNEGNIEGLEDEIRSIYESPPDQYWLTTRSVPLALLDYSKGTNTPPTFTTYDTLNGLPVFDRTIVFPTTEGLRFGTAQGIYQFDEQQQRFSPDTVLVKGLPRRTNIFTITADTDGNLWIVTPDISGVARRQSDQSYTWDHSPFLRIQNIDDYYLYPDPVAKDIVWVGCIDRVIRYDAGMQPDSLPMFHTLIREVIVNGDSLLYGGAGTGLSNFITLKHGFKSLRIRYAAPSFDDESTTLYQYILEGSDSDWSNWSNETYKDYTGMSQGHYRFHVRSKNIYQQIGETSMLEFEILPPFYLTWWAYILYALLFIAILFLVRRREVLRIQKKHAGELKQLEHEKLKELDQLKSRFFANISHEFRTPLTLILGPADNLLASQPDEERARQYHMIKRNAQRLLRLINQLLDLSKLEAGKMTLELNKEDIVLLIKGIAHGFESLMAGKHMELRLNMQLDQAIVNFDRDKMEQILTNLISNAIKFTPDGGTVTILLKKDSREGQLQIEVADTGPGISKDQLPYVFDRFYQGTEAAMTGEPGSGIGLALAKELVELHQGQISVSSVEHQGTIFSITLPYFIAESPVETESNARRTQVALSQEELIEPLVLVNEDEAASENTLLLVEDNPDMRAFIRDNLVSNYRIIEASDGLEGVNKAFESIPDIIISDVMMPRMDGLQLCEILKQDERTSHIPIILLTAKASIESRLAGLKRGADDYLAKPFHREELLIRSRNLLDVRQRLRDRYMSQLPPAPTEDEAVQIEDAFLQKVTGIVDEHLSESDFEIDELSRLVGMSRSQMFRKIKALTGQSPSLFIRNIRLQRGKVLLETTEMNVSEVAYQVGFSTPTYFSDAFTQTFGFRPSQLRK